MAEQGWHILGAGALGTLMALRLQQAHIPATLLHHRDDLSERRIGLAGDQYRVAVQCVTALAAASVDRLLICTKAGQVAAALARATPKLSDDAVVIAMANGMGFERSEAALTLPGGLRRAVTTAGAYRDEQGLVHAIDLGHTVVGDPRSAATIPDWFQENLARLRDWSWDSQIELAVGRKFSINCVINALTASRRCLNGELLTDPQGAELLQSLCSESEPVLRQLGLWTGESLLDTARGVCQTTAENRSSMLQDVLAGRPTEIEFLNGELLRLAPDAELPLNRSLVETLSAAP